MSTATSARQTVSPGPLVSPALAALPNILTVSRLVLAALFFLSLELARRPIHDEWWLCSAAALFVLGALTDALDGWLARRWNVISVFGRVMDPVADKLLVAAALVSLVHVEVLAAWIAVVIIGRELAVTGLRGVALSMGTVVPASSLGKAKTVSQYVAITGLILEKGVSPDVEIFHLISRGVLWIALALTVISGVDYFYRFFLHTNPKDLVKDRERWP